MNDQVTTFTVPPVVKTVTVRCPQDRAFRIFTADFGRWWPLQTHHLAPDPEACVFEGWKSGRVFERGADGGEGLWGRVEAWEPPRRLAFTWVVGSAKDAAQRVEVTFTPVGSGTRVELVHTGWEKLGDRAAAARDSYDKGWVTVFEQGYAAYANAN